MASELTLTGSLSYARGNFASISRAVSALSVNVGSDPVICDVLAVLITDTVIPLGGVVIGSTWAWFKNLDATNFLEIRVAAAGAKIIRLKPGEFALLRLGSGISAPVAIADTATCSLEYALFSA